VSLMVSNRRSSGVLLSAVAPHQGGAGAAGGLVASRDCPPLGGFRTRWASELAAECRAGDVAFVEGGQAMGAVYSMASPFWASSGDDIIMVVCRAVGRE